MPRPHRHHRTVLRPLAAGGATAVLLAAGCGGGEQAVVDAIGEQTVTVPASPPSTVPVAPQQAPAPPGGDAGAASGGAPAPRGAIAPSGAAAGDRAASATARPRRLAPRLVVHLTRATALRVRPGGPVLARIPPRTQFGSPSVLPVLRRSGAWLAVLSSALPNGRVGWISAGAALESHRIAYRVDASLRSREVVVRRGGRVVERFPVAIGGPGTPTPHGRFAVTDKLKTADASSPYGCCILALNGHQPRTPQGWGGGNRLAIHATNLPQTIGAAASLGCLRAPTDAIRRVVDTVPLGTIVTIRE